MHLVLVKIDTVRIKANNKKRCFSFKKRGILFLCLFLLAHFLHNHSQTCQTIKKPTCGLVFIGIKGAERNARDAGTDCC